MSQNLNFIESEKYRNQVDFNLLLDKICSFSLFPDYTRKKLFLSKYSTLEINRSFLITDAFIQLNQTNQLQALNDSISYLSETDFIDSATKIKKSGFLDLAELNQLALIIEFYLEFSPIAKGNEWTDENNVKVMNDSKIKKHFLKEFRSFVSRDGVVEFGKHPAISKLYQEKIKLENKIRETLNYIQNDNDFVSSIQFSGIDEINGHYVIAIKTDHYRSNLGQIVSRSESGNTLFIEPFAIRELNNARLETVAKIDEFINRKSVEFSKYLSNHSRFLEDCEYYILFYNEYYTKAQVAEVLQFTKPTLRRKPGIILRNFTHPLIENAVPNSLELDASMKGIIISGPNTGGKTVALKAICLCNLLTNFGFFVPATSSEIYPYSGLFYFSMDQQDIDQGLSSFSSEVKEYLNLTESLTDSNLILIDEIFNSTSSEDASALAIGLLDHLVMNNSHIFLSTHHQMLKVLIHKNDDYISAHVGYNIELDQPTYKLVLGTPGSSMALTIFNKLASSIGNTKNILRKAREVIDTKVEIYEELLSRLNQKEIELDSLITNNHELSTNLKNEKLAQKLNLDRKMEHQLQKGKLAIQKHIDKASVLLADIREGKVRKQSQIKKIEHNALLEIKNQFLDSDNTDIISKRELHKIEQIVVGQYYYCPDLFSDVLVKEISKNKKNAIVVKGNFKSTIPIENLFQSSKKSGEVKVSVLKESSDFDMELDCRGLRLEEFQNKVENAVTGLILEEIPFLNIIHGHGTGVLKKWLRTYVKTSSDIIIDVDDSGNDGQTRIIKK